jgi:hypothetical protein
VSMTFLMRVRLAQLLPEDDDATSLFLGWLAVATAHKRSGRQHPKHKRVTPLFVGGIASLPALGNATKA